MSGMYANHGRHWRRVRIRAKQLIDSRCPPAATAESLDDHPFRNSRIARSQPSARHLGFEAAADRTNRHPQHVERHRVPRTDELSDRSCNHASMLARFKVAAGKIESVWPCVPMVRARTLRLA